MGFRWRRHSSCRAVPTIAVEHQRGVIYSATKTTGEVCVSLEGRDAIALFHECTQEVTDPELKAKLLEIYNYSVAAWDKV